MNPFFSKIVLIFFFNSFSIKSEFSLKLYNLDFLQYYPEERGGIRASQDNKEIYFGTKKGVIYAISLQNKKILWTFKTEGEIFSPPLISGDSLFFGSMDGCIYHIERKNGSALWEKPYCGGGAIGEEPVLNSDKVFFVTKQNRIFALDKNKGTLVWKYEHNKPEGFTIEGEAGIGVYKNLIITGFSDGYIIAFDSQNGKEVWKKKFVIDGKGFTDVDVTPLIDGEFLYTGAYGGGIFSIKCENGDYVWKKNIYGPSSVEIEGEYIFLTSSRGYVYKLQKKDGTILWMANLHTPAPSKPVSAGRWVIVIGGKSMFFINKNNGFVHSKVFFPEGVSKPPLFLNGRLFFLTNGGYLHIMRLFSN